jgi:Uma2 family endonuclease
MNAAKQHDLVSVEDYLAGELASPVKHEYLGGFVHAMARANNVHNLIAMNIAGYLFASLKGRPCRPYNSDTKIRIRQQNHTRFYYCDASVICRPNEFKDSFQDEPVVIFEVLSRSTRRIDQGEKKDAYLDIPSLRVYLLVEQETPTVVAFRRAADGFVREVYDGLNTAVLLPEIGTELPLAEIYDAATFASEPAEDEQP